MSERCLYIYIYNVCVYIYIYIQCLKNQSTLNQLDRWYFSMCNVKNLWRLYNFKKPLLNNIGLTLDIEKLSLNEIKSLSFNHVSNSLLLCFVYLVLFYKPF